jgi:hypothetical protein
MIFAALLAAMILASMLMWFWEQAEITSIPGELGLARDLVREASSHAGGTGSFA